MKSKALKLFLLVITFLPVVSFAFQIVPENCAASSSGCGFNDLTNMFNSIVNWILVMTSVIAGITFVYAGIRILLNPANPGERTKALDMFKKALIGIAIVLLAWTVVKFTIEKLASNPKTSTQLLNPNQ